MSKEKKLNIPNRIKTHYWGIEELMAAMLNKTEDYENDEIEDLADEFYEEFEVDTDAFHKIVEHLLPFAHISKSPLSEKILIGFANHTNGTYILKEEIELL